MAANESRERMGGLNPWYHNVDLRILQDLGFGSGTTHHGFQLSLDILNLTNLISSDWGVRKTANALATSPLSLAPSEVQDGGEPIFNFSGATSTYSDDLSLAVAVADSVRPEVLHQLAVEESRRQSKRVERDSRTSTLVDSVDLSYRRFFLPMIRY